MQRLILLLLTSFVTPLAWAQIPTPLPFRTGGAESMASGAAPAPAASPSATSGGLIGYVPDATYKLRTGDAVSFQILEDRVWTTQEKDIPKSLAVTDSGELDVPYIGRVMAVDKTCKQLAEEIKVALEKDYYHKATVVLSLNVANRILGRVYIWGQVRSQGPLEMQVNENLTAGQAILRAGGFTDFANETKVKVVRGAVGPNGEKQTLDLDLEQILKKGKTEKDILLQPGDFIIVPSRLINF